KTFNEEYVEKLKELCAKYLVQNHQFVCLSDREIPGINVIRIKHNPAIYGWWSKIELFNSKHGFKGRMMYFDLDTLPVSCLDPIANFSESHAAFVPTAGNFNGSRSLRV